MPVIKLAAFWERSHSAQDFDESQIPVTTGCQSAKYFLCVVWVVGNAVFLRKYADIFWTLIAQKLCPPLFDRRKLLCF